MNTVRERGFPFVLTLSVLAAVVFLLNSIPDCVHHGMSCGGAEFLIKFSLNLASVLVPAAAGIFVTYLALKYLGGEGSDQ